MIKETIYEYLESHHDNLDELEKFSEHMEEFSNYLKEHHIDAYIEFKEKFEKATFVITDDVILKSLANLKRKDKKEGIKWTIDDTSSVAEQYGIHTEKWYDKSLWFFALNYTFANHYEQNRSLADFVKLAEDEYLDENISICKKVKILYCKNGN